MKLFAFFLSLASGGSGKGVSRNNWGWGDFGTRASRNNCERGDFGTRASRNNLVALCILMMGVFSTSLNAQPNFDLGKEFARINVDAVSRAIEDLARTYPGIYDAAGHRAALAAFKAKREEIFKSFNTVEPEKLAEAESLIRGVRMALLANPLLDSDKIMMIRRGRGTGFISLNSHTHVTIGRSGWDDAIVVLSNLRGNPKFETIYKPTNDVIVRDVDLDFSGDKMLFSSLDANRKWAVFEMKTDGTEMKQLSPTAYPDVDWYDACYLPDGRIVVLSTASYQALPCENGSRPMAQTYLLDPKTGNIRQLTYEQDSDYTPSVTNDGRILYTRWEYSDLMHYYSRILMTMNPDGTSQFSLYGSGSYYPTSLLQAKSIPGSTQKVVGIVSGHHDVAEKGRLVIFDPSLARKYPFNFIPQEKEWGPAGSFLRIMTDVLPAEQSGCVAEIPGWGKPVVGDVCDRQTGNQYEQGKPYFVYPTPLSDKYYLVSAQPEGQSWGIYLADTFDNMTLLAEEKGASMFEPIMLQARTRPPVTPDRITPASKIATVHIADIYKGPGLKGIPRGSVKNLRIFAYHFNYVGTGGHASLGIEAGWDIKRILGTVPVESDGSACFEIPANTPVSLQPLDNDGASLQLMRSWLVGMPGERVSCVGCHEDNRSTIPAKRTIADNSPIRKITPWYGAPRPFGFEHEVYPLAQKFCVGCHDGSQRTDGLKPWPMTNADQTYKAIHPYVRRPGPESEQEMLNPMEYHVSTSPLVQMLKKGHYGVKLDREGWDRLYAWIDLNAPYVGKWNPGDFEGKPQKERRCELAKIFANIEDSPEDEYKRVDEEIKSRPAPVYVKPEAVKPPVQDNLTLPSTAIQTISSADRKVVKLPDGQKMAFVRIPAGRFIMGSQNGYSDEYPRAVVKIAKPFWMSETEVTNAQYRAFDPKHDTRYIDQHGKDHNFPGYIANTPNQPVGRVTWERSMDFCKWMSKSLKAKINLPTEAQWEWASRAGSPTDFFYGGVNDDYTKWANLAGKEIRWNNVGYEGGPIIMHRKPYSPDMNFPLHDERFEDKYFIVDYVGQYDPSPWGLKDIVGNVNEWTRSSYRPYPYVDNDGRNSGSLAERKVARGGSWASRPTDARASIRLPYQPYQQVYDVGFRVIIED